MTPRRALILAALGVAVLLVAGRLLAGAYAGWAWYGALGAGSLWSVRAVALTALRTGLFVLGFAFAFANLLAMRRSIVSLVLPRRLGNLEIGEAVSGRLLTGSAVLLSLILSAAVSLPQDDWLGFVRAQWATPLGEIDPYLGRDIAWWIGWLPFERTLHAWSVTLAAVVGVTVIVLYALTPSVRMQRGHVHISTWVRRHFAVYSAILLLLVAWGDRLDAFGLLIHGSGVRETFVAFDHRVLYPYLNAVSLGTAAIGLLVAWTGWVGHQRATITALLLVLVAGPTGRVALPLLDRRAASVRERATLDRPYHHVRALYTRRAYAVDEIIRGAPADSVRIDTASAARAVSSWDPAALGHAVAEDAGVGASSGAAAWSAGLDGRLSVRIPFTDAAPTAGAHAVQEADPTDADERGGPWPAVGTGLAVLPPVAVGLGLPRYRLMADTLGRIAAPALGTGWRRIALAWSVRAPRIAFDADADPVRTRLVVRTDVRERVQALLPFFTAGATVQAMVVRDSLWWTVELFNASADYPLTEPLLLGGASWRHLVTAGTALVNAHSGRVQVLLPARPEQMTRWWRDHLPALFTPRHAADGDLLAALPPPVDRAVVQGSALARTGFRNDTLSTRVLFQSDDADADLLHGAPTPFVSGAAGHPLAWGAPAVDGIDRVRGVFVAIGGRSPRTVLVAQPDSVRWSAMLDRLQRTADSARMSRGRAHPRRGRVQVIPTTTGTMVLQSFYEWGPDRGPSLAGVAVLTPGASRAGVTLGVALGGPGHALRSDAGLRTRLARLYAELQAARSRGDWAAFGRAVDALGRLVDGRQ